MLDERDAIFLALVRLREVKKAPACAVSGKRDEGTIRLSERAHMRWPTCLTYKKDLN